MKGKIDSRGYLFIERSNELKIQTCPVRFDGERCGDWCPHLSEPYKGQNSPKTVLALCHNTELWFDEFIDERVK